MIENALVVVCRSLGAPVVAVDRALAGDGVGRGNGKVGYSDESLVAQECHCADAIVVGTYGIRVHRHTSADVDFVKEVGAYRCAYRPQLERVSQHVEAGAEVQLVNELDLFCSLSRGVGIVFYLGFKIVAYAERSGS